MLEYKENFGEDIDGNRGKEIVFFELEQSDKEEVQRQVKKQLEDGAELNYDDEVKVEIDGVEFTEFIADWFSEWEWVEMTNSLLDGLYE